MADRTRLASQRDRGESARPRWSPYADPRLEVLADAYALLTTAVPDLTQKEVAQ
jgi:hypothetical protein